MLIVIQKAVQLKFVRHPTAVLACWSATGHAVRVAFFRKPRFLLGDNPIETVPLCGTISSAILLLLVLFSFLFFLLFSILVDEFVGIFYRDAVIFLTICFRLLSSTSCDGK